MRISRWLLKLHLHLSISIALMRPTRPKQYCLQLDIALWCKNQIEHSIWDESLLFCNCACSLEYSSLSSLAIYIYFVCVTSHVKTFPMTSRSGLQSHKVATKSQSLCENGKGSRSHAFRKSFELPLATIFCHLNNSSDRKNQVINLSLLRAIALRTSKAPF